MKPFSIFLIVLLSVFYGKQSFSQKNKTTKIFGSVLYDSLTTEDKLLLDSIARSLPVTIHDSVRLNLLVDISEKCDEEDIIYFAEPAAKIAEKLLKESRTAASAEFKNRILNKKALALNNIGFFYWQQGNLSSGLDFLKLSMKIREQTGDKHGLAESLNNIGEMARLQGNIFLSVDYLNRSLKIREEIQDTAGIIISLNNLSLVYLQQEESDKALENYKRALALAETINDKLSIGLIQNNIAYLYQTLKDTASVLEYHSRALKLFREVGYKQGIAIMLNNMGALYNSGNNKNYEKALDCFTQSLQVWLEIGNASNISLTYINLGNLYLNQGKTEKAISYGLQGMKAAQETGYPASIKGAALLLLKIYKSENNYEKALKMHELFVQMSDSILNEDTKKSTFKHQVKYEYEKQKALSDLESQKEVAIAEEGKKRQQIISYSVGAGFFMLGIFALIIFNRLKITRKQKLQIEEQKTIVDLKNKHITDSISYAKRIQDAILPDEEEFKNTFSEHFIFFRPKNIVSGDFYWLSKQNDKIILAVADCTGHGVPGAFMSMIGNTLLNEIVNEQKIFQPAEILNRLQEGITHALHQESRLQDDGMDISVCLFEKDKNKLTFAGANHSLYKIEGGVLEEIQGDIYSIGSVFGIKEQSEIKTSISFSQKEILLNETTFIYLTSDGFADQRGGEKGKKFNTRTLKTLLTEISKMKMKDQEKHAKNSFADWKGNFEQMDDVLLLGIKA